MSASLGFRHLALGAAARRIAAPLHWRSFAAAPSAGGHRPAAPALDNKPTAEPAKPASVTSAPAAAPAVAAELPLESGAAAAPPVKEEQPSAPAAAPSATPAAVERPSESSAPSADEPDAAGEHIPSASQTRHAAKEAARKRFEDPELPQRPWWRPWLRFCKEVRLKNPGMKRKEWLVQAQVQWKAMPAELRRPYTDPWKAEKAAYNKAMAEYVASGKRDEWLRRLAFPVGDEAEPLVSKLGRDSEKPTKPVSVFQRYLTELRKEYPSADEKESWLKWQSLPSEQRQKYKGTFEAEKGAFDKAWRDYQASGKRDAWLRDPKKPRAPLSAAKRFAARCREKNPALKDDTEADAAWKAMPEAAQAPFKKQALAEKREYDRLLREYKNCGGEMAWFGKTVATKAQKQQAKEQAKEEKKLRKAKEESAQVVYATKRRDAKKAKKTQKQAAAAA